MDGRKSSEAHCRAGGPGSWSSPYSAACSRLVLRAATLRGSLCCLPVSHPADATERLALRHLARVVLRSPEGRSMQEARRSPWLWIAFAIACCLLAVALTLSTNP